MAIISELAPAKVNLTLEVLGKRSDGFHELSSLVAFAREAADVVTLDTSRPAGSIVTGPFGSTISGKNLIDVTLAKLAGTTPELHLGTVHLTKNLPIAAGIGGGSADAAAVLRAVRAANPLAQLDWQGLARALGADVPVCFENSAAWMTGLGERIEPLSQLPVLRAVLVNPLQPMPPDKTAQVFRALDAPPLGRVNAQRPPEFCSAADLIDYMRMHGNALEQAACRVAPVIEEAKRALAETPGYVYGAVSGGGPTCFGIFSDVDVAAASLQSRHREWWVRAVSLS